jgi:hypothetical protein
VDWHKYIKKLIENPNLRQDLGEALHQTVLADYMIDKVNVVRGELVASVACN